MRKVLFILTSCVLMLSSCGTYTGEGAARHIPAKELLLVQPLAPSLVLPSVVFPVVGVVMM